MKNLLALLFVLVAGITLVACQENVTNNDLTYTVEEKEELLVKAFYDFTNTQEGKTTIKNNDGITSVTPLDKTWDEIKHNHPVTALDNSNITIKFGGSTSVEKIARALSAQFKGLAGNFIAEHNHTGSGDAVKLTQGQGKDSANKLHIAFASRDFSEAELQLIKDGTSMRLAFDAVVAIVNKLNELNNITKEELVNIYNQSSENKISNWSSLVPGFNQAVKAYTRDTSSGTREAFFELIGFKAASKDNAVLVDGYVQVESNGALLNAIKGDIYGIGYVSLASIKEDAGVKALSFEGVIPSEEAVLNNSYSLKRPFNMVIRNY